METMTNEKEFYNAGIVKVTNARILIGKKTYSMNGITSVKDSKIEPNRVIPIIAIVIGVGCLIGKAWVAGAVLVVAGGLMIYFMKPTFFLVLTSSSGEANAHHSKDEKEIDAIVAAVNNAMISRG